MTAVLPLPAIFDLRAMFEDPDHCGLIGGSTVLVSGRAGAGKSFFALSLVREQIRAEYAAISDPTAKERYVPVMLYVGLQFTAPSIREKYGIFGWFVSASDDAARRLEVVSVDESSLPQPQRGAEDVINPLVGRLRTTVARLAEDHRGKDLRVYVVFDTVSALVKGGRTDSERQRYVQELVETTAGVITKDRLGLCVIVTDSPENPADPARPDKDTVARYVFHLGFHDLPGGGRRRTLDVRKSPQAPAVWLGVHSWAIAHTDNADQVAPEDLRRRLQERHCNSASPDRWGAILVFPGVHLPPAGQAQDLTDWTALPERKTVDRERTVATGVPGLDQMLTDDSDYWAQPVDRLLQDPPRSAPGGLFVGSTTLLIGRSGTGKTNCCLQFLLANIRTDARGAPAANGLYINFENPPHHVREWYPGDKTHRDGLTHVRKLFRRPSGMDVNQLLCEIRDFVDVHRIDFVAIDGLSDLRICLDGREYDKLIGDVVAVIRQANAACRRRLAGQTPVPDLATIYISIEADPDRAEEVATAIEDSPADNVICFRHVRVNENRRKTVEVRKSRGQSPDRQVRELRVRRHDPFPLRIVPGLDNYRDVAEGRPLPVRVALQLVHENANHKACNRELRRTLRRLFAYGGLRPLGFAREEIVRTLQDIASGLNRIPFTEVKLLHVDEWWIRELRTLRGSRPDKTLAETPHPLLRLNRLLTDTTRRLQSPAPKKSDVLLHQLPSDFWSIEMEKVCVPALVKEGDRKDLRADVVALPAYADNGLFCLNRELLVAKDADATTEWSYWLQTLPRHWVQREGAWFAPPRATGDRTLVDFAHQRLRVLRGEGNTHAVGFAFDLQTSVTSICVLLELCWAFGATEDVFVRDLHKYASLTDADGHAKFLEAHPMTDALKFLMYLVVSDLMPERPKPEDAERALFSRHWYSSLGDDPTAHRKSPRPVYRKLPPKPPKNKPATGSAEINDHRFLPLPFFPVGPTDTAAVPAVYRHALHDAALRFDRLVERIRATARYRLRIPDLQEAAKALEDKLKEATFANGFWRNGQAPADDLKAADVLALLQALREAGQTLREHILASRLFPVGRGYEWDRNADAEGFDGMDPEQDAWRHLPYAMFLDLTDIVELLRWHDFRVDGLEASLRGVSLDRCVRGDLGSSGAIGKKAGTTALSGYACEGAWTIAADRTTRSPNLAANFLSEIASRPNTQKRAELGAGIPARKDFYALHGDERVPLAPQADLTWNELLRLAGSRSRRRTRAFCSRTPLSRAFEEIDRHIFHSLAVAAANKAEYGRQKVQTVEALTKAATAATCEFFAWLAVEFQATAVDDCADGHAKPTPCVTCPMAAECEQTLKGASQ